ncbi:MAG TPA: glutaredoxin family protein [Planctomycetota bacterium]|nr:glutaredoxin family protein [Planctomycetota bacterium]
MRVVLYGKPECCLCDLAESRLRAMAERRPFDLVKVDIRGDPALERRFGITIPAVEVDGVLVSEGRFDENAVEARIAAALRSPSTSRTPR